MPLPASMSCVGDLMLDNFVYGEAKRISPEAPVPVLRYSRELKVLGGSGNVVRNVAALGANVVAIGVVGDDAVGAEVAQLLGDEPRVTASLVAIPGRPTTSKVRYLAGSQQMVRVDREEIGPIGDRKRTASSRRLLQHFRTTACWCSPTTPRAVLTDRVCAETIAIARQRGLTIVVEPKTDNFARYGGATVIVANADETSTATRLPCRTDTEAAAAAREAMRIGSFGNAVTTRSDKGMVALDRAGVLHSFPAKAREVFDVTGAGDTVNATIAPTMLGAGACWRRQLMSPTRRPASSSPSSAPRSPRRRS